jgi:dipeptidyl-peptidase 4
MHFRRSCIVASILALPLAGQQTTKPDYARAEQFFDWNLQKRVMGVVASYPGISWLKDGERFWYRVKTERGNEFKLVDPAKQARRFLFDNTKLGAALSLVLDTAIDPAKLPITSFELDSTIRTIEFDHGKSRLRCDIVEYRCAKTDTLPSRSKTSRKSPDGKWEAFTSRYNLYIRPIDCPEASKGASCGDSVQLTTDGDSLRAYGDEGAQLGDINGYSKRLPARLQWSPDSKMIVIPRADWRGVKTVVLYSSTTTRPTVHTYPYGLPGDSVISRYDLHVIDVPGRRNVQIQGEQINAVNDLQTPSDSGWGGARWSPQSDKLYYLTANRGVTRVSLNVANPRTGESRRLVTDSSAYTTINVGPIRNAAWRFTRSDDDVYWFRDRDGWGHIYRLDAQGNVKAQVTSGPWSVESILYDDRAHGQLFVTGNGREPDRFVYHTSLYRVPIAGGTPTLLTPEPADHYVQMAPSGRYFVDWMSTHERAPVLVVRSAVDGRIIMELERADISRLTAIGWKPPELVEAVCADGVSKVYGMLWKPSDFDSTKRYPVIDYIYPVPGGSVGTWGWQIGDAHQQLQPRALAELGFIVTQITGRGTRGRSRAFYDAYQGRMGLNTVPDHVTALQQLAARYRWMDIEHVGTFGISGGGFASTAAILRFPDFYKAAVSMNGNHDNRTYGAYWGEKYQGPFKVDPKTGKDNFEAEANYTLAGNLKGKLLLMVSDLDDNVHPSATLRLVHALIAANKRFDFMLFPDRGHGLTEPYPLRMMFDHFVRNLMGVDPPDYTFAPPSY